MIPPLKHLPLTQTRADLLSALAHTGPLDVLVVGGGATGLGIAVDAANRGLRVALVEAEDFAKGTSSRATKLVHGGVRYLAQGNIALVKEALRERAILLANAPHLAQPLPFVMPSYQFWESALYGTGLRIYDALATADRLPTTESLSKAQTEQLLPNVNRSGLRGGIRYWDAQFDDARLAIALARTAVQQGAHVLNYARVTGLLHDAQGKVSGAQITEHESGQHITLHARCVINATGVWVDQLRQFDEGQAGHPVSPMVAPSQGAHLVVDRHFWPGDNALLVPKTRDGRVLFAVPWLGHVILGTTDQARQDLPLEPRPSQEEAGFILTEAARYLAAKPSAADVRSQWAGLRPLVKPPRTAGAGTPNLSRGHTVHISAHGLVTVTGGKWTTYRAMAEDVLRQCQMANLIPVKLPSCQTAHLPLVGSPSSSAAGPSFSHSLQKTASLSQYGSEAALVQALPGADVAVDAAGSLTEAMVRFAVRYEYARTVEDVLARRSRLLFVNAAAAAQAAPRVAAILAEELGTPVSTEAFLNLAKQYQMH